MSITIAKWTIDEYPQLVESGILDDLQIVLRDRYQSELKLTTDNISPLSFPDIQIEVEKLFT
jgi:hypothetical protein